jgi:hypothetical protein
VILHFQNRVIFCMYEVEAAAPRDSARRRGACEEIGHPLDEVKGDAEEGVEAEREEVGVEEAPGIDDGAPALADAA